MLMQELLEEGYEYIFTRRLQSDPLGNRFSQYRQMSGGRFLASLREVLNTERTLTCLSVLKENFNLLEEGLKPVKKKKMITQYVLTFSPGMNWKYMNSFCHKTSKKYHTPFQVISIYIKKLIKGFQYEMCSLVKVGNNIDDETV